MDAPALAGRCITPIATGFRRRSPSGPTWGELYRGEALDFTLGGYETAAKLKEASFLHHPSREDEP
jgi:hypothetical protein